MMRKRAVQVTLATRMYIFLRVTDEVYEIPISVAAIYRNIDILQYKRKTIRLTYDLSISI